MYEKKQQTKENATEIAHTGFLERKQTSQGLEVRQPIPLYFLIYKCHSNLLRDVRSGPK